MKLDWPCPWPKCAREIGEPLNDSDDETEAIDSEHENTEEDKLSGQEEPKLTDGQTAIIRRDAVHMLDVNHAEDHLQELERWHYKTLDVVLWRDMGAYDLARSKLIYHKFAHKDVNDHNIFIPTYFCH